MLANPGNAIMSATALDARIGIGNKCALKDLVCIAEIKMVYCTLTDENEQTFIFSSSGDSIFNKESWDYRSCAARLVNGERLLGLSNNGCSCETSYYAFPGQHTLSVKIQALDAMGNQRIDERIMHGEVTLPMGADCELNISIPPDDRDLTISVISNIWK